MTVKTSTVTTVTKEEISSTGAMSDFRFMVLILSFVFLLNLGPYSGLNGGLPQKTYPCPNS